MSVTYSFVVRDGGDPTAATGLTPSFVAYTDVDSLTDLSGSAPTITEVGDGHYKFTVDWDTAPESTGPSNSIAIVIDADAGLTSASERYITARINRTDSFATDIDTDLSTITSTLSSVSSLLTTVDGKVDTVDTVVDSISVAVATVDTVVDLLFEIETGKWEVTSGNQLKIYKSDGVTLVKTFDLYDSTGNPTSVAPARREPV